MKTNKKIYVGSSIIALVIFLGSCSSGSDPIQETAEQVFMKKITGTWNSSIVTYDGVDVTKSFQSMSVSFGSDKSIKVINPVAPIWKTASTFVLQPSGSTFQIKRNDGLLMDVETISSDKIAVTFLFDASKLTGRSTSVVGNFKFDLTK